jgi:hypothetical protein
MHNFPKYFLEGAGPGRAGGHFEVRVGGVGVTPHPQVPPMHMSKKLTSLERDGFVHSCQHHHLHSL